MFLGIEIGGTKLSSASAPAMDRRWSPSIDTRSSPRAGRSAFWLGSNRRPPPSCSDFRSSAIGIGFGGPVDSAAGRIIRSHQIEGWHDFPLC